MSSPEIVYTETNFFFDSDSYRRQSHVSFFEVHVSEDWEIVYHDEVRRARTSLEEN